MEWEERYFNSKGDEKRKEQQIRMLKGARLASLG